MIREFKNNKYTKNQILKFFANVVYPGELLSPKQKQLALMLNHVGEDFGSGEVSHIKTLVSNEYVLLILGDEKKQVSYLYKNGNFINYLISNPGTVIRLSAKGLYEAYNRCSNGNLIIRTYDANNICISQRFSFPILALV